MRGGARGSAYRNLLLKELLALAALGTIAGVVPLTGRTGSLHAMGCRACPASAVSGHPARLIRSSGRPWAAISGYDVGF